MPRLHIILIFFMFAFKLKAANWVDSLIRQNHTQGRLLFITKWWSWMFENMYVHTISDHIWDFISHWWLYKTIRLLICMVNEKQSFGCASLSIPYCVVPENIHTPPHGRDFSYDPPTPLDFPKTAHKLYPSPPPEIPIFSYTPWKCFYFLFKVKY